VAGQTRATMPEGASYDQDGSVLRKLRVVGADSYVRPAQQFAKRILARGLIKTRGENTRFDSLETDFGLELPTPFRFEDRTFVRRKNQ
jgi:hypothetical protein